ncbi:hypothetical protein P8452_52591 [Trifolium repens]|nr:hypothetical protein P8452_52591 [Trifolium repens]
MYAKCGDLCVSMNVILMMPIKDVVAWSTMIFADVMHGNGKEAFFLLEKMLLSRPCWSPRRGMPLFKECLWNQLLVLAKISAKKLFEIRPKISGYYVTLFNILVTAKLWEEKLASLCNHSEKLAVAFRILNLNGQSTIQRLLGVSSLQNGNCSCKDLW